MSFAEQIKTLVTSAVEPEPEDKQEQLAIDAFDKVIDEFVNGLRKAGLDVSESRGRFGRKVSICEELPPELVFRYRPGCAIKVTGSLIDTTRPLDTQLGHPAALTSRLFNYVQSNALALHRLASRHS